MVTNVLPQQPKLELEQLAVDEAFAGIIAAPGLAELSAASEVMARTGEAVDEELASLVNKMDAAVPAETKEELVKEPKAKRAGNADISRPHGWLF